VLTRLLREAREYVALQYTNHHKRAKRRAMAILLLGMPVDGFRGGLTDGDQAAAAITLRVRSLG